MLAIGRAPEDSFDRRPRVRKLRGLDLLGTPASIGIAIPASVQS